VYIVQSIIQVPGYKTEDLIGIYRNRSRLVDEQPGFVSFQLLQSETAPEEFVVQTTWQTKSDYIAWVKGTDFQRIHYQI
jgi:heme-degrading monooxygenase HmoA